MTPTNVAAKAGISWAAANRYLRLTRSGKSVREPIQYHDEIGTELGFSRHRHRREAVCRPCREAHAAHRRQVAADRAAGILPTLMPCGTMAAYKRHLNAGEPPCDLCRAASYVAQRARRERAKTRRLGSCGHPVSTARARLCRSCRLEERRRGAVCGTAAGYKRHRREQEPACAECLAAKRARGGRRWTAECGHLVWEPGTKQCGDCRRPLCGTTGGYSRHTYLGTVPCGPCKEAQHEKERTKRGSLSVEEQDRQRAYRREWMRRRRAATKSGRESDEAGGQ